MGTLGTSDSLMMQVDNSSQLSINQWLNVLRLQYCIRVYVLQVSYVCHEVGCLTHFIKQLSYLCLVVWLIRIDASIILNLSFVVSSEQRVLNIRKEVSSICLVLVVSFLKFLQVFVQSWLSQNDWHIKEEGGVLVEFLHEGVHIIKVELGIVEWVGVSK